eukprot:jgi/Mesen1/7875/ME000042S07307
MDSERERKKVEWRAAFEEEQLRKNMHKKILKILKIPEKDRTTEEVAYLAQQPDIVPQKEESSDEFEAKLCRLAQLVKDAKCEGGIVIHTGAGLSTAAGIPDFRGANGVWTMKAKGQAVHMMMRYEDAFPTAAHGVIAELVKKGLVKHVVTQNVDGLHTRSGVPRKALSHLHGCIYEERCLECGLVYMRPFDVTVPQGTSFRRHETGRFCDGQILPVWDESDAEPLKEDDGKWGEGEASASFSGRDQGGLASGSTPGPARQPVAVKRKRSRKSTGPRTKPGQAEPNSHGHGHIVSRAEAGGAAGGGQDWAEARSREVKGENNARHNSDGKSERRGASARAGRGSDSHGDESQHHEAAVAMPPASGIEGCGEVLSECVEDCKPASKGVEGSVSWAQVASPFGEPPRPGRQEGWEPEAIPEGLEEAPGVGTVGEVLSHEGRVVSEMKEEADKAEAGKGPLGGRENCAEEERNEESMAKCSTRLSKDQMKAPFQEGQRRGGGQGPSHESTGREAADVSGQVAGCGGRLVDTIVHFGEWIDTGELETATAASEQAGLAICLGSTLKVPPASRLPRLAKRLVIVNLQWTAQDRSADLKIHGRIDDVMLRLAEHLGLQVKEYSRALDPLLRGQVFHDQEQKVRGVSEQGCDNPISKKEKRCKRSFPKPLL